MTTLQVWQCGGQVLIATCSRVGHVFRKVSPYTWPGGVAKILNHNTMRTVEVWMDDHKNFFYAINPSKVSLPKFYCGKLWSNFLVVWLRKWFVSIQSRWFLEIVFAVRPKIPIFSLIWWTLKFYTCFQCAWNDKKYYTRKKTLYFLFPNRFLNCTLKTC